MKISELVDLKQKVKKYLEQHNQDLHAEFVEHVSHWENTPLDTASFQILKNDLNTLHDLVIEKYNLFFENIEKEIDNQADKLLTFGYTVNNTVILGPTPNADADRQYRQKDIDQKLAEQLGSKIRKYTDWRTPVLEIGPGDGNWTDNLVGSDPLYLVDIHQEYLKNTTKRYNKLFGDRIRCYLSGPEANKSHLELSFLPNNQIGFIFSWQVFDYLFVNEIEIYLNNCYNVLRPGGTFIFSFNNCDFKEGAILAEEGNKTWVTEKIIKNLCHKIGFEFIEVASDLNKEYHWAEIRKPGTITSMKVAQPKLSILRRPGYAPVDNPEPIVYNKQQIARIKRLAIQLGIDTDEKIMGDAYSPEKLLKLVNIARIKK